jgi:Tol biopolymer transport system component
MRTRGRRHARVQCRAGAERHHDASVDSGGAQGNLGSTNSRISRDGRYVVFHSAATNFVPPDTNANLDIFRHDRATGATTRVSVDMNGGDPDQGAMLAAIDANGDVIAFESVSTDLVPGDTNNASDVFARDLRTATTVRVSVDSQGVQGNGNSAKAAISGSGRFVAFQSDANNLVPGDTNLGRDIFVHDLVNATTERVNLGPSAAQSNGSAGSATPPAISFDGRFVAFQSIANNYGPMDPNSFQDIYVRDRLAQTTSLASLTSNGASANGNSLDVAISADGQWVAFASTASNLVPGDTNGAEDVFVRDAGGSTTIRVSVSSTGVQATNFSRLPALSGDGHFVVFESFASNLVANDTNGKSDVFLYDLSNAQVRRVSVSTAGAQGNGDCTNPDISADGFDVSFHSGSVALVANDTNAAPDVFVHDADNTPQPVSYCTAGTTSSGCNASISGAGSPSATASSGFVLDVTGVEGQRQGLIFYGVSGRVANPWGPGSSSFLCVNTPTQRTPVQSSGGTNTACDGVFTLDFNAYRAANSTALGQPMAAGLVLDAQAWFRDPPAPKTTNLSNAFEFTLVP